MSDRHPLIGVAYDVRTDGLGKGLPDETETVVPIGYDESEDRRSEDSASSSDSAQDGNLRVDHYCEDVLPELGATRLWTEDEFVEHVADNRFVEEVA